MNLSVMEDLKISHIVNELNIDYKINSARHQFFIGILDYFSYIFSISNIVMSEVSDMSKETVNCPIFDDYTTVMF